MIISDEPSGRASEEGRVMERREEEKGVIVIESSEVAASVCRFI